MQAAEILASAALALLGPALAGASVALADGLLPAWIAGVGGFVLWRASVGAADALLRSLAKLHPEARPGIA